MERLAAASALPLPRRAPAAPPAAGAPPSARRRAATCAALPAAASLELAPPSLAAPRRRSGGAARHKPRGGPVAAFDPAQLGATAFDLFAGTPLKQGGTLALSAAAWQAVLYASRTYILGARAQAPSPLSSAAHAPPAAHLSNNTPRGAKVVEFGSENGLTLNYYPVGPDAPSVFCAGTDKLGDPALLATVAAQAGVTLSGTQRLAAYGERLSGLPGGGADCVVSVRALGGGGVDAKASVFEVARLLKPRGRFLFFEDGGAPSALTETLAACGMFSSVIYDRAWAGYPLGMATTIGVAERSAAALTAPGEAGGAGARPPRVREPASTARGFAPQPQTQPQAQPPGEVAAPPPPAAAEAAEAAAPQKPAGFGGGKPQPPPPGKGAKGGRRKK